MSTIKILPNLQGTRQSWGLDSVEYGTSLDQEDPEFKIDHPQNTGWINIFFRSWRYYEGQQSHDKNYDIQIVLKIWKI